MRSFGKTRYDVEGSEREGRGERLDRRDFTSGTGGD
jgi:hypothetical protein